ncbi:MAG: ROK family protein [Ruminococcaceae bacterium]|nr:ROK family protein [Oscillospiraceae bacterium]
MYLGIDLGGTNIAVGLVDRDGNILHKDKVKTRADRHYSEIVKDMAELSKKVTEESGFSKSEIEWVGIGSPGSCDSERGVVVSASNLNFKNTPIREEFQKHWNVPVYLANDADCAAYGEAMRGNAKGTSSSVTVTLGSGVGGGVIINGNIMTGVNFGSELGHMIINFDGEKCKCGNRGCWEVYASANALVRQTREAMKQNPESLMWKEAGSLEGVSGRTAFSAAKKGDAAGQKTVDKYLEFVAIGISNIIEIFQPEKILIGGGVANEGESLLQPIRNFCKSSRSTIITTAALGNDAGIIGAAFLGAQYAKKIK